MSDESVLIAMGMICGIAYMTAGIGVARATSKIAERDLRIVDVFFWPIALGVLAAVGATT